MEYGKFSAVAAEIRKLGYKLESMRFKDTKGNEITLWIDEINSDQQPKEIQSETQNPSKENMTDKEAEKIFQYALESGLPISLVDGYARNKKILEEKK